MVTSRPACSTIHVAPTTLQPIFRSYSPSSIVNNAGWHTGSHLGSCPRKLRTARTKTRQKQAFSSTSKDGSPGRMRMRRSLKSPYKVTCEGDGSPRLAPYVTPPLAPRGKLQNLECRARWACHRKIHACISHVANGK